MGGIESKKLALLRILEILQTHSNVDHPLTHQKIAEYLNKDHGIELERKAIARNLSLLEDCGWDIAKTDNGCYLGERTFEDTELRLLIDSVLASAHISPGYAKTLIQKISGLSDKYFQKSVNCDYDIDNRTLQGNKDLFLNIELIHEAIRDKKQITFYCSKLGADKELHKTNKYQVSPYRTLLHNQRYYLFCSKHGPQRAPAFYRVDKMTEVEILPEKATPLEEVKGWEKGMDYNRLTTAFPYMFADTPEHIVFLVEKGQIDQVFDWFGTDITVIPAGGQLKVTLEASPKAMEYWALQYCRCVEVLEPEKLREHIYKSLSEATEKYKGTQNSPSD